MTIQYANEVLTAVVTGSAQQWVFRDIRLSPGNAVGAMLNFIVGKVDRDGASYGDLWFRIMDDGTLRGIVMPTGGTTPDQWSGSR